MNEENEVIDEQVDEQIDDTVDNEINEPEEQENPVESILDEISEESDVEEIDGEQDNNQHEEAVDGVERKTNVQQAQQDFQNNSPEQIEQELLSDVKSERSKARIKQWIDEHNQLKEKSQKVEQTNMQFAEIIRSTGMNDGELAQTLEFCRLSRQNDEASLQIALDILEKERSAIYARMGKTVPGSDALDGFDDLKEAIDGVDITDDYARELAELRRFKTMVTNHTSQQAQMARQQEQMNIQYRNEVLNAQRDATAMFEGVNGVGGLKSIDPNYQSRVNAVGNWLKNGGQQKLVNEVPPAQWRDALFNLYQTLTPMPDAPVRRSNTPISGRPQTLSKPTIKGNTGGEIASSVLDSLGI